MLGIVSALSVRSQTLTPTVISSSGGFYSSTNAMLSFTVAEMTMVQTFTTAGNILTQGFQQPEDFSTGIPEIPTSAESALIYPNPTNGSFTLSYLNNGNAQATINIYNLTGQIVLSQNISQVSGLNTVDFDISAYSQGIYMLGLTLTNSKGEKKTDYHKINLIY
jgi:hypothetical protein